MAHPNSSLYGASMTCKVLSQGSTSPSANLQFSSQHTPRSLEITDGWRDFPRSREQPLTNQCPPKQCMHKQAVSGDYHSASHVYLCNFLLSTVLIYRRSWTRSKLSSNCSILQAKTLCSRRRGFTDPVKRFSSTAGVLEPKALGTLRRE